MRRDLRFPSVPTPRRNGARIPSIAEDVATDFVTIFSLSSGLRRYRFTRESFIPMQQVYCPLHNRLDAICAFAGRRQRLVRSVDDRGPRLGYFEIRTLNKHSFGPATVATHAGFVRDSRRRAREGLQSTHMAGERRARFGLS
jgi:hypothetical protein